MSDAEIEQIKEVIEEYERLREEKLSEADVLEAFVARLFRALGWETDSPLEWNRQKYIREGGYADVALQIGNRPVIFLEAKKLGKIRRAEAERQPLLAVQQSLFDGEWVPSSAQRVKRAGDRTPEEKQALRYARADVKVKWAILTNFERLLLFDADEERIILAFDAPHAYVDRFDELKLLQRDQVAEGSLDWYKGQLKKAEIDEGFYDFLLEWRKRLAQDIYDEDKKRDKRLFQPATEEKLDLLGQAVQRTLDRLIIIRYADDVGALLQHDQLERILTSYQAQGPYAVEYDLQQDVNSFYRAFYREHDTAIFASPHTCEEVLISNKTMEALLGDLTNISFRKFTSDILGNTYESYLGHKLKRVGDKIELEARRELRKGKGIYYTPTYIVRYIVDNTLGKYLYGTVDGKAEGEPEEGATRKTLADICDLRVLDPAMGSGSFLIYAFDVLADFYERENKRIEEENAAIWDRWGKEQLQKGMFGKDDETPTLQATEPNYIEKILQEHLYGVDLDREAVEIAGVNLIMRAFDRMKKEPTRGERKLPLILRQNLKVGNSLISGVRDSEDLEPHREALIQLIEKRKELTQVRGDEERNKKLEEIEAIAKPVNEALNRSLERCFGDDVGDQRAFNWEVEFPEAFNPLRSGEEQGFTVIIGNPPYGADLTQAEQTFMGRRFPTTRQSKNTAIAFIELAVLYAKSSGRAGLIVPKSLSFAQKWRWPRELVLRNLRQAADVSEAFRDVLLEQVIIILGKEDSAATEFSSYKPSDGGFEIMATVPTSLCKQIDVILMNVSTAELSIFKKMLGGATLVRQIARATRGLPFQKHAKLTKGLKSERILRGDHIQRYLLREAKVYVEGEHLRGQRKAEQLRAPKVIAQRIVAHVTTPAPRIVLMATYDDSGILTLDTVENITITDARYSPKFLTALINSTLVSWFVYLFVFNKAVRTMDFDNYYIGKIPLPKLELSNDAHKAQHDRLGDLAGQMLDLNRARQKAERAFTETLKGYEREYVSLWKAYYDHSEYRETLIERQPLIDANEKGELRGIKVDEDPDTQSLRIAGRVDDEWRDIARLNIANEDFRLFLFFGLRAFLEEKRRKKIWARGKILRGVLEALQVPVLAVAKADLNINRIKEMMNGFKRKCPSEALHLSQLEATLRDTDAQIDDLVYDLYGITAEERQIIEASLK